MPYADITVIVAGAVEAEVTFRTNSDIDAYVAKLARSKTDYPVEVYMLWHNHREKVTSCECVQYVDDHHPDWTFGPSWDEYLDTETELDKERMAYEAG